MALYQPDILQHNNPNLAISNSDFVKGGIRTGVATINDLYSLSGKTDLPSAEGQVKEHATIVYVSGATAYYVLVDATNIDNAAGWEVFNSGSGSGTLTGATNGLQLVNSGTTVILGGDLTGDTVINLNNHELQFSTSGVTQNIIGIDADGILFSISGGSRAVLFDDNSGMRYADDYHADFIGHSLIDKDYADAIVSGLKPKQAVLVATTPAGGAITLSGLTTIDTVALSNGDRVLVKDQGGVSGNTANGVYVASASTWSRSEDFDGTPFGEVVSGSYMWVLSGDTNANSSWVLSTPDPITIDTTPLQFVYFNHVQNVVSGDGIDVTQSGGTHIISINLGTDSGLNTTSGLVIDPSIAGTALSHSSGVLNVNATNCASVGAIPVGYNAGDCLVVACSDITTAVGTVLSTANNGLTAVGTNVALGGSLTGDTTISGGTNKFEITGGESSVIGLDSNSGTHTFGALVGDASTSSSLNMTEINGFSTFSQLRTAHSGGEITEFCSVAAGTGSESSWIMCDGSNENRIRLWSSGNMIITDGICEKGLQYTGDYEDNFNARSLVTLQYVTGITSGITGTITGGANGLSTCGSNVVLGGTLTGLTSVDGVGYANSLGFSQVNTNDSACIKFNGEGTIDLKVYSGTTFSNNETGIQIGCQYVRYGAISPAGQQSMNFENGCMIVGDTYNSQGLVYGGDYETQFTGRSLVTKQYVESVTSGITGTITGGTNGLSTSGSNVVLGGDLTGNTTINVTGQLLTFTGGTTCISNAVLRVNGSQTVIENSTVTAIGVDNGSNCACIGISAGAGFNIVDSFHSTGLKYLNNYCAAGKSNPRWIPDNEYIGNYTQSAITANSNIVDVHNPITTIYTATTTNDFVGVTGGSTVYLPTAAQNVCVGQRLSIVDVEGDALANNILVCSTGYNILDSDIATINTNYGSITFIFNGVFWSAVSFIN